MWKLCSPCFSPEVLPVPPGESLCIAGISPSFLPRPSGIPTVLSFVLISFFYSPLSRRSYESLVLYFIPPPCNPVSNFANCGVSVPPLWMRLICFRHGSLKVVPEDFDRYWILSFSGFISLTFCSGLVLVLMYPGLLGIADVPFFSWIFSFQTLNNPYPWRPRHANDFLSGRCVCEPSLLAFIFQT